MKQIIVDCNYICWTSHYAMKSMHLTTEEDQPTGVIFGLLRQVIALSQMFKSNEFFFCFDGPNNKRKKIFPGYKAGRDQNKEERAEVNQQIELLCHEILPKLGFNNVNQQEGIEADDLLAVWTDYLCHEECIVVTGDEDLYQLITSNVSQYLPVKKKLYTLEDFRKEQKLEPSQWSDFKAIAGCGSDKIPGIVGMGPKKTRELFHDHFWMQQLSGEERRTYSFFRQLTTLPIVGTAEMDLWEDELTFKAFIEVCEEYEFDSLILHDSENWERIISGDFSTMKERVSKSLKRKRKGLIYNAKD